MQWRTNMHACYAYGTHMCGVLFGDELLASVVVCSVAILWVRLNMERRVKYCRGCSPYAHVLCLARISKPGLMKPASQLAEARKKPAHTAFLRMALATQPERHTSEARHTYKSKLTTRLRTCSTSRCVILKGSQCLHTYEHKSTGASRQYSYS